MFIGLAACAPIGDPPPGAPVVFSRDVVRAWHEHRTGYVPRYFLVSQDGLYSVSVFTRLLDCRLSEPFSKWQRLCESRSGQECYRFARLGHPAWHARLEQPEPESAEDKETETKNSPVATQITREAICFPRSILLYPDHRRFYNDLLD